MEGDLQGQGSVAVAESTDDVAQPSAQLEAGAPGGSVLDRAAMNVAMNDFMRGMIGNDSSTLKPAEAAASGEPAPSGDVEAGSTPERGPDGRFLSRRGVPEVARLREEIRSEILAEQAQAADTAKLGALEQTRAADVAKYRRLIETPDDELWRDAPDDYQWREEFKARLRAYPEVEQLHKTLAEQEITTRWDRIRSDISQQMARLSAKPGVDAEAYRRLPDFGQMGDHLYEAGGRARQPEIDQRDTRIAALERELHAVRTSSLGAARAPVDPGRSSAGRPVQTMNDWLRGAPR